MSMVENASDWAEICQLKSAYGWHYDAPDLEALVDLFTDDAVCVFGAYGTWHGKEEIRAGFAENVGAADNAFPSLHTFANPMIAIDGDEATGKWYLLDFVLTGAADEPVLRVMGVYDERYRREDARWRIAHMHLTFLWNSDVGRIRPGEERKLEWHADAAS
jgi:ketosteroid isomerase-like protein